MAADTFGKRMLVLHPKGHLVTAADLPPLGPCRWTAMRKAEVVVCVRAGLISIEQACERYRLTEDEFLSWKGFLDDHGVSGLRSTRIQKYRSQFKHSDDPN